MRIRKWTGMLLLVAGGWARAEIVVIAHPGLLVDSLPRERVAHLFLGLETALPDGTPITPLIVAGPSWERFAEDVLGKSTEEVQQYWARMSFRGRVMPPRRVDAAELNALVANTPGAMAFVERRDVSRNVKIIRIYHRADRVAGNAGARQRNVAPARPVAAEQAGAVALRAR